MQFVNTNAATGTYAVTPAAADWLSSLPPQQPLAVVVVVGAYRAGKSTLLNSLVGDPNCFATSATVNAQTRGLWLCPRLLDNNTLIIDSEGLGSTDATATHDVNIFALSNLLASTVIFNSVGAISSASLDSLRLSANVAKLLGDAGPLASSPPALLWTLRDMSLKMQTPDGKTLSATGYVEQALDGSDIGNDVRSLFPRRTAIALPKPTESDRDLATMRNVTAAFRAALDRVAAAVKEVKPKVVGNGVALTPPILLSMVRAYVDALNAGDAVPKLRSVWDAVLATAEAEKREAKRAAVRALAQRMAVMEPVAYMQAWAAAADDDGDASATFVLQELLRASEANAARYADGVRSQLDTRMLEVASSSSPMPFACDGVTDATANYALALVDRVATRTSAEEARLRTQLEAAQARLADACGELREVEQRTTDTAAAHAAALEALRDEHRTAVDAHDERVDALQRQLAAGATEAEDLQAELAERTAEVQDVRKQLEAATAARLGSNDAARDAELALANVRDDLLAMTTVSETLSADNKAHAASVQRLEEELQQAKESATALEKRCTVANDALADARTEAKAAAEQAADAQRTLAEELRVLGKRAASLEKDAQAAKDDAARCRKRARTSEVVAPPTALVSELAWLKERRADDVAAKEQLTVALASAERRIRTLELLGSRR